MSSLVETGPVVLEKKVENMFPIDEQKDGQTTDKRQSEKFT